MDAIIQKLFEAGSLVESLTQDVAVKYNTSVDEYNEVVEHLEERDQQVAVLQEHLATVNGLLNKQTAVIEASVVMSKREKSEINVLKAQLRELRLLDPKRLEKVNKANKKQITELKEKLATSEKARKEAIKRTNTIAKNAQNEGTAPFHYSDKTKNALRVIPGLYVGGDNEFNGIPGTAVVEFMHHSRGITRQGMMLRDGTMGWAAAGNSKPTAEESLVARAKIEEIASLQKLKLNYTDEEKAA